jgi:hypothetical protein
MIVMKQVMENPEEWASGVRVWGNDEERATIRAAAERLLEQRNAEHEREFRKWAAKHELGNEDGLARYVFAVVKPQLMRQVVDATDHENGLKAHGQDLDHLRDTLHAVEQTLNLALDRITALEQRARLVN